MEFITTTKQAKKLIERIKKQREKEEQILEEI